MSEIPSEFFSKRTFKSLPQLAFLTWLVVLIVDAVILQRFPYSFIRVLYVWVLGMSVSLLFELVRYKYMDQVEKAEYKKFFFILNAFLIFLYASSYAGFTKQIGAWGEIEATVNEQGPEPQKSGILLVAQEWAIPLLAKQTSYFPDVTAIAENNELKKQNALLEYSLAVKEKANNPTQVQDLISENSTLKQENNTLKLSLRDCEENLPKPNPNLNPNLNPNKDEPQVLEIEKLRNEYNQLKEYYILMNTQIDTLQQRIYAFNRKQSEWAQITGKRYDNQLKERMISATHDANFFNFLFYTPIDATLPGN